MNIEHSVIDNIHLLTFQNEFDLASTFLRFQEYYESPKFSGTVFSLDEYKEWYTNNSPNGIKTGKFTYYEDWGGFNIPSTILKPFYDGQFDPLSESERRLLDVFKDEVDIFYIIGIHREVEHAEKILEHEIAHGLFFTNAEYRNKVYSILSHYNTDDIKKELLDFGGYNEKVLDDEVHAYSISDDDSFGITIPEGLRWSL